MRRNDRRNSIRKERTIMMISSAFVLAALTMTGLYMRGQEIREKNDGYTLDFTALENSADNKLNEIAQSQQMGTGAEDNAQALQNMPGEVLPGLEDDLDYMPLEAGSDQVEIPGLTAGSDEAKLPEDPKQASLPEGEEDDPQALARLNQEPEQLAQVKQPEAVVEPAPEPVMARELHFSEASGLLRPVSGSVLIPYSMDKSVYFSTLDQYKRNPATIFEAPEGTEVFACAAGKVVRIFDDAEIGHAVVIDMGDGYQATYGQLTDIRVKEENYIEAGDKLGTVAPPTKYYVAEGANLYFRVEKDGQSLNSENLF